MPLAPDSLGPTISIGEILAEVVATTIGSGFSEPIPMVGPFPSGAPTSFIVQCSCIGGSAAMIGAVGDDAFGQLNLERMKREGVDVSGVTVDPDLPTGTAFVRYRPDGTRDFVFNLWTSAAGRLAWTDAVDAVVSRAGHLHVVGTMLGVPALWSMVERAAQKVRARGGTVSFDPNMRKELQSDRKTAARVYAMLAMTDLLLPSGEELLLAADMPPQNSEEQAIKYLFSLGIPEIVIKRGAHGSTAYQMAGGVSHAPAFAVEEIDPTGACDCFGGAYVATRRLGLSVDQALIYANAAGARNVTRRGPMEGAGSRSELDAFIAGTERITCSS
ncbi:MAG: sugar kinase [Roseobacter sp. MedPE-SWde]|nr:MAG: sugar kinase [Roseobacter sp. MedPE-SWde]